MTVLYSRCSCPLTFIQMKNNIFCFTQGTMLQSFYPGFQLQKCIILGITQKFSKFYENSQKFSSFGNKILLKNSDFHQKLNFQGRIFLYAATHFLNFENFVAKMWYFLLKRQFPFSKIHYRKNPKINDQKWNSDKNSAFYHFERWARSSFSGCLISLKGKDKK